MRKKCTAFEVLFTSFLVLSEELGQISSQLCLTDLLYSAINSNTFLANGGKDTMDRRWRGALLSTGTHFQVSSSKLRHGCMTSLE